MTIYRSGDRKRTRVAVRLYGPGWVPPIVGHKVAFMPDMLGRSTGGSSMRNKKTSGRYCWRVMLLKPTTPAELLGHVFAPGEESALAQAAEKFAVPLTLRNRLLALRIESSRVESQTASPFAFQAELAPI